ncbi:MAG: ATP synthase F1 subunit delta [Flavobacteriales bacterium]|nr:ATP synthase F1 subunit delta [Flavobacteriales bacterium]MBJ59827.1 ATP synthase F1 subunit delta [Flavobacteriales bacterium]|tara:strand:- start:12076 stop:12630 length:555 start_codon:yes stop_codon:yes gene_type:complete
MRNTRAISRYAKSLLGLAKEQNTLELCKTDMVSVVSLCQNSRELVLLLKSPVVKTDKKLAIIAEVFVGFSPLVLSFINLITKKKREALLFDIAQGFLDLYKIDQGIESATLTTAISLDEHTRQQVLDFIKKQGVSQVDLTEQVDESLIGGAILRLGDKQLDASVARQIKDLKQSFNKNLYIKDF